MDGPTLLIALIAAVLAIGGLGLMFTGLRGRRINDHPMCRRCRFDLIGVFPAAVVCPECGAALDRPGAVRRSPQRIRRGSLVAGAALLIAAVSLIALGRARPDLTRYKPTWWLTAIDLRRPPGPALEAAAAELASRLKGGSFPGAAQGALVDRILELQAAAPARGWSDGLGDLFELAWDLGGATDDQALRYMKQSLSASVSVDRPYEAFTAPHTLRLERPYAAGTVMHDIPLQVVFEGGRLHGPDGPVEFGGSSFGAVLTTADRGYGGVGFLGDWLIRAEVPAGEYPVELRYRLRYDLGLSGRFQTGENVLAAFSTGSPPEREDLPFVEWTATIRTTAAILDESPEVFELVRDAAIADAVRGAVSVGRLSASGPGAGGRTLLFGFVGIGGTPVGVEGYIVVRQGEREWDLPHLRLVGYPPQPRVRRSPSEQHLAVQLAGLAPGPLDIILRPDPRPATWAGTFRTRGVPVPIWGEDIVVRAAAEGSGAGP